MNIKFADEKSHEAFVDALNKDANVPEGARTLGSCILGLMRWCDLSTATIALDPWPNNSGWPASFTFAEVYPDGRRGIFGGIVCHEICEDGKRTGRHCYGIHT
jgi:hypothetical protein